ncbi:MAG: hypothetical protein MI810_24950 [Flavobacteriales bacterium]|nr:hypothetical protein [Flavobacteriales bacterium]
MNVYNQIKDRSSYSQSLIDSEEEEEEIMDTTPLPQEINLHGYIQKDIDVLLRYSFNQGKQLPDEVGQLVATGTFEDAFVAHKMICDILKPATPETIKYQLQFQKKSSFFISNIPLVRNFILIAVLSIAGLILSSLSPLVNETSMSVGILNNSGIPLMLNLIFLCSASAIGAVFFILSKLTKEVKNATLSVDDITYYWIMLIMGMLSGLILCEIIVLEPNMGDQSIEMNKLMFALLGGFSSEIVFSILEKIMEKVRDLITGS